MELVQLAVIGVSIFCLFYIAKILLRKVEEKLTMADSLMRERLESISKNYLLEGMSKVHEASHQELQKLLQPFNDKLQIHERKMDDMLLREEIGRNQFNETIKSATVKQLSFSEEAKVFSKAMRGNIRALGKFNEDQAELILESSGFHEGVDYEKKQSFSTQDGGIRPDFLIRFKPSRSVFLDAKMSLDHFMRYFESEDEMSRNKSSSDFLECIKNHVTELSKKNYQKCLEMKSLDFVLMYIGSDLAIELAFQKDRDLKRWAMSKGILIVGPTNLMAVLKSIEFILREEKQIENLKEIAGVGEQLYEGLFNLIQKLREADNAQKKASEALRVAFNHLNRNGKSSILSKATRLNELGGFSQKTLPEVDE